MTASLRLALRCPLCGATSPGEVRRLLANPRRAGHPPFVADVLTCPRCGETADLAVADEAMDEVIRLVLDAVERRSRGEDGPAPVVLVDLRLPSGRPVSPGEALETLLARTAGPAPRAVDLLDLGRLWVVLERPARAREAFAGAIRLDGDLVEAALDLAGLLETVEEPEAAMTVLVTALDRRDRWIFRRLPDGDPVAFGRRFAPRFNALRRHLPAATRPPALHPAFLAATYRRLGRNDPCPCGRGKRFRLCCGTRPPVFSRS